MSSRDDRRRRERSWEKDNREKERDRDRHQDRERRGSEYRRRRDSRSRSPRPSHGDRDRDGRSDRRGYEQEHDSRRGRDRRDERLRDDRRPYDRVDKRDSGKHPPEKSHDHDKDSRSVRSEADKLRNTRESTSRPVESPKPAAPSGSGSKVDDDLENGQTEPGEEVEPMDAEDEEPDMMALMGFGGFDSTKGKPVQGNQEGAVNIKKQRTWRQYMNRRGGFNRPLDKIK